MGVGAWLGQAQDRADGLLGSGVLGPLRLHWHIMQNQGIPTFHLPSESPVSIPEADRKVR